MDYEKLYKEAIARIRKYTKDEYGCTRLKPEDIFPELAKSEDVVIKEKIIATIHLYYGEPLEDEAKEMIAWLEKQGEQKSTAEEVLIKAGLKPYKDGDQWCILLGDNIQEGICGFGDTIDDALYAFLNDLIKSLKEQKPAWSEEDEDIKDSIIHQLKMLRGDRNVTEGNKKEIEWLKSLRPQSQWKPSDEQLNSLYDVLNPCDGFNREVLESLYQDLKKLGRNSYEKY